MGTRYRSRGKGGRAVLIWFTDCMPFPEGTNERKDNFDGECGKGN